MNRNSKILITIVLSLVFLSACIIFYRYMILHDYLIVSPSNETLFLPNVLVYYNHIPALLLLTIGIVIFLKNRNNLSNQVLFFITSIYYLWVLMSLTNSVIFSSNFTMFTWAAEILIEPLIHIGCLYLLIVTANKKDNLVTEKIIWFLIYLPLILIAPTRYLLSGFDASARLAVETSISNYSYLIEIIFIIWIIVYSIIKLYSIERKDERNQFLFLSIGILSLLVFFTGGNLIGSLTDNWNLAQAGLIGMPIFLGFLSYLIIRYKTFNIKLLGAQVGVVTFSILILSLGLIKNLTPLQRIIIFITFLLSGSMGYFLIKSTRKEIELMDKLKELDEIKTNMLSVATHDIGSPLTVIKGYVSMMQEGNYSNMTDEVRPVLAIIQKSADNLVGVIRDFEQITSIAKNEMGYTYNKGNLKNLVDKVVSQYKNL